MQRLAYEGQFISSARQYENYYEYDPTGKRTLLSHGETGAENLSYCQYDAANELTTLHERRVGRTSTMTRTGTRPPLLDTGERQIPSRNRGARVQHSRDDPDSSMSIALWRGTNP